MCAFFFGASYLWCGFIFDAPSQGAHGRKQVPRRPFTQDYARPVPASLRKSGQVPASPVILDKSERAPTGPGLLLRQATAALD
jgi:hypothetical protein